MLQRSVQSVLELTSRACGKLIETDATMKIPGGKDHFEALKLLRLPHKSRGHIRPCPRVTLPPTEVGANKMAPRSKRGQDSRKLGPHSPKMGQHSPKMGQHSSKTGQHSPYIFAILPSILLHNLFMILCPQVGPWLAVRRKPLHPARGPQPPRLWHCLRPSLLSVGEKGCDPYHRPYKHTAFTVFCGFPIFSILWIKMGQHGPT